MLFDGFGMRSLEVGKLVCVGGSDLVKEVGGLGTEGGEFLGVSSTGFRLGKRQNVSQGVGPKTLNTHLCILESLLHSGVVLSLDPAYLSVVLVLLRLHKGRLEAYRLAHLLGSADGECDDIPESQCSAQR